MVNFDRKGALKRGLIGAMLIVMMLSVLMAHYALSDDSTAQKYEISGNSVEWENSYGKVIVTPHTIRTLSDGCFEVEATSYIPTQDIDCAVAGNSGKLVGKSAWLWQNISHDVPEMYYENETQYYTCAGNFNYTLSPKYAWCFDALNGSLIFEHSFEGGNLSSKTIWWKESRGKTRTIQQSWFDYQNINDKFSKQEIAGKDYYIISNINWMQNTSKKVKLCFDANIEKTANGRGINEKLDIFCKQSSDTIQEAISSGNMFIVDPWWIANLSESWNTDLPYRKVIQIDASSEMIKKYYTAEVSGFNTTDVSKFNLTNKDNFAVVCNQEEVDKIIGNTTDLRLTHNTMFYPNTNGWGTTNTTFLFRIPFNITGVNNTACYLYYGNISYTSTKNNISNIALLYDDFELNNMNGRVCGGNVANGWIAGASRNTTYITNSCGTLNTSANWGTIAKKLDV